MGVKGLWSLLNPVSRPVQIESLEGKRMAIDSSIWLYQFQATMRDKDGRVLVNAHVLGFLRRINKLLFHGIKPVFVFDGGAPNLKRATIAERKRKKMGAAANHAKMAEKLFAAQMRREAVKAAQASRDAHVARQAERIAAATTRYDEDEGEQIAENAIFLEDLEGRPGVTRPPPPVVQSHSNSDSVPTTSRPPPEEPPDPAEARRRKFKKHDPYKLPDSSMPTVSTENKPDARLATEEELKQFIDEMHPEDIDVESAEFRALPTEVQYEIIGDMRIRSRQQSHRRLGDMLRAGSTALDFSLAQIRGLNQRNALTQQLLTVTDMVGKAHLTIPVRIAAERNREYVLVKRGENDGGGWALGIREGTKQNPIKIEPDHARDDSDDSEEDSTRDSDVEEVEVQQAQAPVHPELREHRRQQTLQAIAARYAPTQPQKRSLDMLVKPFGRQRPADALPLFASGEDDIVPTANDEALALALQQEEMGSDEEEADPDLARALAVSRQEAAVPSVPAKPPSVGASEAGESDDSFEEVSVIPSGRTTPQDLIETPLVEEMSDEDDFEEIAPLSMPQTRAVSISVSAKSGETVSPVPAVSVKQAAQPKQPPTPRPAGIPEQGKIHKSKPIAPSSAPPSRPLVENVAAAPPAKLEMRNDYFSRPRAVGQRDETLNGNGASGSAGPLNTSPVGMPFASVGVTSPLTALENENQSQPSDQSKDPGEAGQTDASYQYNPVTPLTDPSLLAPAEEASHLRPVKTRTPASRPDPIRRRTPAPPSGPPPPAQNRRPSPVPRQSPGRPGGSTLYRTPSTEEEELAESVPIEDDEEMDEEEGDSRSLEWSKSPSPRLSRPSLQANRSISSMPSEAVDEEDVDMNRDDMDAEEDDYARFMAQIKNRDLNEVRTEIDDEIRILNQQNKVAMRDSEEITQVMVAQIQTLLRHFGIPYITAPMEAEAQCAKLAELGLVDGVITDDSDVFLFGGLQCFKNIFNDAKYAECFLLADINRELSLSRERLISLAYLLGSDYTVGLPGVGPVVALELLSNFPGPTGVEDFKEWWTKVQRGQDSALETNTKWRQSFKKRYSHSIFLTAEWPNHLVREAYIYPATDESEEPFYWGFPKLSALRAYLHEELSWSISKVDDELTPIVQRIARRGKLGAVNKQATLDPFFDTSVVGGNYAPRRRTTANVSKRLMGVIKQFREAEAKLDGQVPEGWGEMMVDLDEEDPKGRGTGKRRKSESVQRTERETVEAGQVGAAGTEALGGIGDGAAEAGEEEGSKPSVKRTPSRGRKRKGTESSVSRSDVGTTESLDSVGVEEGSSRGRGVGRRGSGRGRGRGRKVAKTSSDLPPE